jgi:hypothetical protein
VHNELLLSCKLYLLYLSIVDRFAFVDYCADDFFFCLESDDGFVARTSSRARAITGPWGELRVLS